MSEHENEDTHPERRQPKPPAVSDFDDLAPLLALDLDVEVPVAPVALGFGSRPSLDVPDDDDGRASPPSRRAPLSAECWFGGKHFAVETDGTAVSLVLLKAMTIVATPAEALTLAKALLRAVALARR